MPSSGRASVSAAFRPALGCIVLQTVQALVAAQNPLDPVPRSNPLTVPAAASFPSSQQPFESFSAENRAKSLAQKKAPKNALKTTAAGNLHFATYSTFGFEGGMVDLCSEAQGAGIFATTHCFDKIPDQAMEGRWNAIRRKHSVEIEWLYQPAIVQHLLRNVIPEGDVLFFAEPSVEITHNFTEWSNLLDFMGGHTGAHLLAFQRSDIPEYEFTKADVFREFGVWMDDLEVRSYQITSSYFILKNIRPVHLFINDWANLIAQPKLLSDTPSHAPNHELFLEHHHEASLWSMLVKAQRHGSSCRPLYIVQDLKVRILPYRGCDDMRKVELSPIQAHCERHREGLKNRLRKQQKGNEIRAETEAAAETNALATKWASLRH